MKNEIIKIDSKEFGIKEQKAKELMGNLPQLKKERDVLETQFNEIIKLDIKDLETSKKAKSLRLLIQKNRTQGINIWHKTTKDFFLRGGQFVDAIKRKEIAVNERMESQLEEIEKHFENLEKERLEKLQIERVNLISEYVEDAAERDLKSMDLDVWNAYFEAKKKEHFDRIQAELQAEKERVEKEKAEKAEQERIKKENERLKKEAEEKERLAKIEAEKQAKIEAELKAKAEAERKEKERIEKELQAKKEAEQKAIEDEKKRIQAELNKGDSAKVNDLIADLEALKTKYSFKSEKNKKMYSDTCILIDKVINHIK